MLPTLRRTDSPFDLLRDFDRLMTRGYWDADAGETSLTTGVYPVDIRENGDHIIVEAELPGFKQSEIDVTLEKGILSIVATREAAESKDRQHLAERRFTRVARRFSLPVAVDENAVEAHLDHGVLTLKLPKREEVKPRKIQVK